MKKPKVRCVALHRGKRCRRIAKYDHTNRRGNGVTGFEIRLTFALCESCSIQCDELDANLNRGVAP